MKKIFTLGLLLAPMVANATDPVGPSAVPSGGTAVVATASAPYQTAAPANGDSTTVVSASYVKGAYNDAIAAVNKVAERVEGVYDSVEDEIADKQDKLETFNGSAVNTTVWSGTEMLNVVHADGLSILQDMADASDLQKTLVSVSEIAGLVGDLRVKAVTTWGSDNTTTNLPFVSSNE